MVHIYTEQLVKCLVLWKVDDMIMIFELNNSKHFLILLFS